MFFEQPQLERLLGNNLFALLGLAAESLDLVAGGGAGDVAGEPLLAGLQELLGPAVVETFGDAFAAAELGDAHLAAQRIASSRMLPEKSALMTGAASPNRFGGGDGRTAQHGCAARGFVGGGGALQDGVKRREGAHS